MNMLAALSSQPWVERLGWTLLHFVWQGAAVATVYAFACAVFRRGLTASARYALACAALAAMMAAPVLTLTLLNGVDLTSAAARTLSGTIFGMAGPAPAIPSATIVEYSELWRASLPSVVALWLAGALAFSLRLAGGWIVTLRLRSADSVRRAPAEWECALDGLIRRIGVKKPVQLLVSSVVNTPVVSGWIRPAILTPVGMLTGLPTAHVEALLAHELAHIRRHDYLVNLLQSVAETVLFYHPAVWWLSGEIRAERELCCDDLAVEICGDALTYAHALAELETSRPERFSMALAANGSSLARRIRRLLDPSPTAHAQPAHVVSLAPAILLLAGVGMVLVQGEQVHGEVLHALVVSPVLLPAPAHKPISIKAEKATPALSTLRRKIAETRQRPVEMSEAANRFEWRVAVNLREPFALGDHPQFERDNRFTGHRVGAIELRGFTDEAGNELLARLPVREGDVLTDETVLEVRRMIERLPGRVECGMGLLENDEAVLRIHPAGLAGADLIHRK